MTFPDFKLVTAPTSSATVLVDLNATNPGSGAAPREVQRSGLSFGAPELIGDADAVEPLYGPRTIQFTVRVTGSKARAVAFLSSLQRVLVTGYTGGFIPGLWLRVQLNPLTQPMWFRLRRPNPQALSWDNVAAEDDSGLDIWDLPLQLPAEAFGYGALETIAAQTLNSDPTHATNPCRIDLGTIKGDAPAPLRIEMIPGQAGGPRPAVIVAHAASSAPAAINQGIGTGDGLTAGTDTGAAAADAAAVGGSKRVVSFATSTSMVTRLSGSISGVPAGRYKVLLRYSFSAGNVAVRFTVGDNSVTDVQGATITVPQTPFDAAWMDLGDFTFPIKVPQQAADQGVSLSLPFMLAAQRVSGAGQLTLDHLLLIPLRQAATVESRSIYVDIYGDTNHRAVVDGDTEDAWHLFHASNTLDRAELSPTRGVFPRAIPGASNALWVVRQLTWLGENLKTHTLSVTCRYYPRYLDVPGA